MNKAKVKFLQQCADLLPAITEKRSKNVSMLGREIGHQLKENREGKPIIPGKRYKVNVTETVKVDHLKKLKAVYNSGGMPAVKQYTEAVQALHEASNHK